MFRDFEASPHSWHDRKHSHCRPDQLHRAREAVVKVEAELAHKHGWFLASRRRSRRRVRVWAGTARGHIAGILSGATRAPALWVVRLTRRRAWCCSRCCPTPLSATCRPFCSRASTKSPTTFRDARSALSIDHRFVESLEADALAPAADKLAWRSSASISRFSRSRPIDAAASKVPLRK